MARTAAKRPPLYLIHASSKAVSAVVGWSEYDQLARQVILARECDGYSGSIFNDLSRLVDNPKECTTKLIGYYDGTVKAQHILTNLVLTKPAKQTFTSFDAQVVFAGATDPNTEATINGDPITTDENGYFTITADLRKGSTPSIFSIRVRRLHTISRA